VFDHCLNPFSKIIIEHHDTEWGAMDPKDNGILYLSTDFPDKDEFINVLAHEMVHQWQWQYADICDHGTSFQAWEGAMMAKNYLINY